MPGHIFRTLPLASTYTYDGAGNRTVKHLTRDGGPSTRTTCVYDGANQLDYCLEGSDRTTYSYDPAGNLEKVEDPSGALTTHTWDDENRRLTIAQDNGYAHTATYNADGLRIEKRAPSDTSGVVDFRYFWDGQDLLAEYMDKGVRSAKLSITHKCFTHLDSEMNVGQPRQAAPEDSIPRRSIVLAIEVAAELGDHQQVMGHVLGSRLLRLARQVIQDRDFRLRKHRFG
ncbi:MAG: RHS repeat protein [Planctomycetota bacterium]|nr:MAG: RHS repeat protein [Planctomycetota bacterium]REK39407.1 MAG: RHS repeat protein [Planctomycetota bacterium]